MASDPKTKKYVVLSAGSVKLLERDLNHFHEQGYSIVATTASESARGDLVGVVVLKRNEVIGGN